MELIIGFGLATVIILILVFKLIHLNRKLSDQLLKLKLKEQSYQSIYQNHPDMIIRFDLEGNVLSVNRVDLAYGHTEEEMVNQSFFLHVVPEKMEQTIEYFHQASKGKSINYETSICSKNGQRIELYVTNFPISVDEEIIGVCGIFKDITEHKKTQMVADEIELEQVINPIGTPPECSNHKWMEEALKVARQELMDTIRQQQGLIFKFTENNGKFLYNLCDGRLLDRMALTSEQIIGKELSDFFPSDDAKVILQYYWKAWRGKDNVTYEGKINGVYFQTSLQPIRKEGQVVEVVGSCVDITERKQVENALKLSESNYRLITENMLDLLGIWDLDGRIIYASPSHEVILGLSPKVYYGALAFDLVHPDDSFQVQEQFLHLVSTKTPFQIEFRSENAQGEWIYIEVQGTPVIGENDEVEHVVVVGRDISERREVDEYLCKAEKLSIVGQLAAGVAHEIRNPLTSIKGFLQIMQKEMAKPNFTGIMLSEIESIEKIIREFLSLAKPQARKLSPTDIHTLLLHVVTLIHAHATLNNVEIVQETESELPLIHCDDHQIKQVFINILQNAVDAMSGGGVIKIQTMRYGSDDIMFRFIDQGCGISEDRIKNICEPFYSTKEKGTGLGLMISHKIIQEHGGTINIESTVNQGTIVDVILPIKHSLLVEV